MSRTTAKFLVFFILGVPLIVGMFFHGSDHSPFHTLPLTVAMVLLVVIIAAILAAIIGFVVLVAYAFSSDKPDNPYRGL